MEYLEIIGAVIGLIYLYLEYHANVWLWVVGVIMPAVYIFVFYNAGLYADMAISIYYLLASAYGLFCWVNGKNGNENKNSPDQYGISIIPQNSIVPLIIIGIIIEIAISVILQEFTDSTVPWADGFTTALSIVAMWMLAKKYVEQWLVWIVADIGCCLLYVYKDLYFTSALYALYAIIAVVGYRKWIRLMKV